MNSKKQVLIVDDDKDTLTAAKLLLKRQFAAIITCDEPEKIPGLMSEQTFDAILLDMNFAPGESSGEQGFYWLKRILEIDPDAVVVMITAHGGIDLAVEAMKRGATDFISKPWVNEKVVATLSASVQLHQSRVEATRLKHSNQALVEASVVNGQQLLGKSKAMKNVHSIIQRTAPTDANILILGENGTGKELVAQELHRQSLRADSVFMSIDLGALSESLFESELFGYKKGAFTGANKDHIGRLVAANKGTLFLDEIGNIPLHLQAKLLTVLEQRKVTPIGTNKEVSIDVRVIAATNVPRNELADERKFRQDLLFRLNTVEIILPPLHERVEDIPEIAEYYADLYSRKYRKMSKKFTDEAISAAKKHHWPGNIRALRHAVERAVIFSESPHFSASDLQLNSYKSPEKVAKKTSNDKINNEVFEDLHLERTEKRMVEAALKKHRYNISKAAKELGLTRASLYRRMEKYGF